jgi:hypothetical protein
MSGFNMPPGVSPRDIPGNGEDECEICGSSPLHKVCEALVLAESHTGEKHNGSAMLALQDARTLHIQGRDVAALQRAMTSLRYSVGIFHPDYQALEQP